MSKKKFQIFISSTYLDLKEERQAAVQAILSAGHIPAGMELFASGNRDQWDVIKKWIDESDMFVLILGGRYGSVEKTSKKSYTHLEYDYAVTTGKPFFALYLDEKMIDQKDQGELEDKVREKDYVGDFKEFRKLVMSKLSAPISNLGEIKFEALKSINILIEENRMSGWMRADQVVDSQGEADSYGITITSPSGGDVIGKCDFRGTILKPLPVGYELRLTRAWPNLKGSYPMGERVEINGISKTWIARDCDILGNPGDTRIVRACVMGPAGLSLAGYFPTASKAHWDEVENLRGQTQNPPKGKPLPPIPDVSDTFVCDSVTVKRAAS
ncbi:DUF4062 domain-containing protein [Caballeronia sp. 15715]|uniref:DUF4062 domain-containing protein n=1 Tax=Caballeronia sp. 15715 TaxID=3391030 RepID=UPI0039E30F32